MKSVKLTGIARMETFDVPQPQIKNPTDVLIRVKYVGVCGSDIHYFTQGKIGSQVIAYPFTVGHEMAGVVETTGSGVTRVKAGQRIAVDPLIACYECAQCRSGRYHTCRSQKFLGCPGQLEGCLSEYIVLPESCCYPVPDTVSNEAAVLCEPLAIGFYAVLQSVPLKNKTAAILGAGPIGLSVLLACLDQGAARVYLTDKLAYRCQTALDHGACWAGSPATEDVVRAVTAMEPEGLDAVFECCGRQDALDQAVALVKPGGKIMIIGIPEFERYSFSADIARRNEVILQHVRRQNECTQLTIDKVAGGRANPLFMATHDFNYTRAQAAFKTVAGYKDNVIKAMVHF